MSICSHMPTAMPVPLCHSVPVLPSIALVGGLATDDVPVKPVIVLLFGLHESVVHALLSSQVTAVPPHTPDVH
jgi:hypothetical protein